MHKNSKIAFIGIEAEGGFDTKRNLRVCEDGSVSVPSYSDVYYDGDEEESNLSNKVSGEVKSEPINKLRTLSQWIRRSWPDRTNHTCGLHIHLSCHKIEDFALLLHKKFYSVFLQSMERWGKKNCVGRNHDSVQFWKRFRGENQFCLREFYPLEQLKYQRDKYTQLNLQSFRNYKTLECRLFPAFKNVKTAISGVSFYIRLVDYYLKHQKPNEFTVKYLAELKKYS